MERIGILGGQVGLEKGRSRKGVVALYFITKHHQPPNVKVVQNMHV